jgi:hypothetical protein
MNDVDIATHSLPASFIAHLMPRHVVIFAPDFFDLPARAAPTAAAAALPISGPRLRIGIDRVGNHAAERLNRAGFGVVVETKPSALR